MSVPSIGGFRHHVAGIVDDIGVVAGAADHRVGAGAAVEPVVGAVAGEDSPLLPPVTFSMPAIDVKPGALPVARLTVSAPVVPV